MKSILENKFSSLYTIRPILQPLSYSLDHLWCHFEKYINNLSSHEKIWRTYLRWQWGQLIVSICPNKNLVINTEEQGLLETPVFLQACKILHQPNHMRMKFFTNRVLFVSNFFYYTYCPMLFVPKRSKSIFINFHIFSRTFIIFHES